MNNTKINANQTIEMNDIASKYVKENFGSIVAIEGNGIINVYASNASDGSGWDTHTSQENADYIVEQMKEAGFVSASIFAPVFEVGSTYEHNFIGDSELFCSYIVTRRTEKTIWIQQIHRHDGRNIGEVVCCRVAIWDGIEVVRPFGSYSMAPSMSADDIVDAPEVIEVEIELTPADKFEEAFQNINNAKNNMFTLKGDTK